MTSALQHPRILKCDMMRFAGELCACQHLEAIRSKANDARSPLQQHEVPNSRLHVMLAANLKQELQNMVSSEDPSYQYAAAEKNK